MRNRELSQAVWVRTRRLSHLRREIQRRPTLRGVGRFVLPVVLRLSETNELYLQI